MSSYFTGRSEFCFIDLLPVLRLCLWIWTKYRLWQLRIDFSQKTAFLLHALQYFDTSRVKVLYLFNSSSESHCLCSLSNHLGVEQVFSKASLWGAVGRGGSLSACAQMVKRQQFHHNRQTLMECYSPSELRLSLLNFHGLCSLNMCVYMYGFVYMHVYL